MRLFLESWNTVTSAIYIILLKIFKHYVKVWYTVSNIGMNNFAKQDGVMKNYFSLKKLGIP